MLKALKSSTWQLAGSADKKVFMAVMALHFIVMLWYNSYQTPACDESGYFSYALRWAKGEPQRLQYLDDSKTPMVFPALFSLAIKPKFPELAAGNGDGLLTIGRMGMYIYYLLLSFGIFLWLYRLFGPQKWIWPWLIFLADPLIFSNAVIIGSDLPSAACWLWAAYLTWRYAQTGFTRYWWLLASICGVGMVIKPSMVFVIPLVVVLLMATHTKDLRKRLSLRKQLTLWAGFVLVCWIIINAAYQFREVGTPFNKYMAQSEKVKTWQNNFPVLSALPIPVSAHYFSSFDLLWRNMETGGGHTDLNTYHGIFLNKEFKWKGKFWDYYLWHFFYKITPLLMAALLGSAVLFLRKKENQLKFLRENIFIWLPPLFFIVLLSVSNPFQIGIRHALPAWPFLYLIAAPAIVYMAEKKAILWIIIVVIQMAEIARQWPNMTAYTPVWMQPKQTIYKRIKDATLTYCNDAKIYQQFLKEHPEYKTPTPSPEPGWFALRIDDCNSLISETGPMTCWLTQYFEPVDHYKTSILLFHITIEEIESIKPTDAK